MMRFNSTEVVAPRTAFVPRLVLEMGTLATARAVRMHPAKALAAA